ncbi:SRPBCC family protein [Leifsonia sp. NPDC102414]|uniref:SRPBCC family protein n=1 Tax=Leifsonia sp. NPDC102414 TaxID=3364124 RepID=UPI0038058AA8
MVGVIVVERHEMIAATPERLFTYVTDFRRWIEWSPWEGLDTQMIRAYEGEPGTIGATYVWDGDKKAGAGQMTIEALTPLSVSIDLVFTRPFKSSNRIDFIFEPVSDATRLTWRMESPKTFFARFFNLDKRVGPDFEKGLSSLATVTTSATKSDI